MQIRVLVFSKIFGSIKLGVFSGGNFQCFIGFKISSWFLFKKFCVKFAQVSKIGFKVLVKVLVSRRFHFAQFVFYGLPSLWSSQVSEIVYIFFSKSFGKFGSGFFARFIFSGKVGFSQSQFLAKVSASSRLFRSFNSCSSSMQSRACKKLWRV